MYHFVICKIYGSDILHHTTEKKILFILSTEWSKSKEIFKKNQIRSKFVVRPTGFQWGRASWAGIRIMDTFHFQATLFRILIGSVCPSASRFKSGNNSFSLCYLHPPADAQIYQCENIEKMQIKMHSLRNYVLYFD